MKTRVANSLAWTDEVALIVFNWAMLLAIASGYLHDKHVNLDFKDRRQRITHGVSLLLDSIRLW